MAVSEAVGGVGGSVCGRDARDGRRSSCIVVSVKIIVVVAAAAVIGDVDVDVIRVVVVYIVAVAAIAVRTNDAVIVFVYRSVDVCVGVLVIGPVEAVSRQRRGRCGICRRIHR